MENLEAIMSNNSQREGLDTKVEQRIIPFGAQYLEKPKIDRPGSVLSWNWQPSINIYLAEEADTWPGTTGTGPTAKEDERYGERA